MSPQYQGVDVNHPDIVRAIRNLIRQGSDDRGDEYTNMRIAQIVGMPYEVVEKHRRGYKKTWE